MTYDGIQTIIQGSKSKHVSSNRQKILALLKEAHEAAEASTRVSTRGASGKKKRAAMEDDNGGEGGGAFVDEDNSDPQHMSKMQRSNDSEFLQQQIGHVNAYNAGVVACSQNVVQMARSAEDCNLQMERVIVNSQKMAQCMHQNAEGWSLQLERVAAYSAGLVACSQNMVQMTKNMSESEQQLQSFNAKVAEGQSALKAYNADFEMLGTSIAKVGQAFVTLATNHSAYLEVKRADAGIEASKHQENFDYETRMSVLEDAKVMRAKMLLEIEKEMVALRSSNLNAKPAASQADAASEESFTINELCKKHKLLVGIDCCYNLEIFKRAGEKAAIEHKTKGWRFAERRDGKSNAYPIEYEAAKLAICKQVIDHFKASQAARRKRGEGQQSLQDVWGSHTPAEK